jgi:hypothetical protein
VGDALVAGLLVAGLVAAVLGFGLGVEPAQAHVGSRVASCGSPIGPDLLVAGTPATAPDRPLEPAAGPVERRLSRACAAALRRRSVLAWTGIVGGAALAIGAWSTRERRRQGVAPAGPAGAAPSTG